jgi:hypothetical protein
MPSVPHRRSRPITALMGAVWPLDACRYVVKCLEPSMEVFHGMPGTAYSFK